MRFAIQASTGNTKGPQHIEPLLHAVHQVASPRTSLTLEIASNGEHVGLFADVPDELETAFLGHLRDSERGYTATVADQSDAPPSIEKLEWSMALRLTPDAWMLRTWQEFDDRLDPTRADPLSGILSTLRTGRSGRFTTSIRLTIRPAKRSTYARLRRTLHRLDRRFAHDRLADWHRKFCTSPRLIDRVFAGFLRLFSVETNELSRLETMKSDRHLFDCNLTIVVNGPADAKQLARQKLQDISGAFGSFTSHKVMFARSRIRQGAQARTRDRFALCAAEIATLWHPPTEATDAVARLSRSTCPELEPPVWLPSPHNDPDVTELGRVQYRGQKDRFGIKLDDRRRHLFICGKTGMGKSTLMLNMLVSDIRAGRGVCLIDPHGDLADTVLTMIPKRRKNDLVLFDVGDRVDPIAWNPLSCDDVAQRPLVAEGVLAAMKKVFGDSWGPRMEDILRHGLLALQESPGSTFLSLQRMLVDPNFRRTIVGQVTDPVVRAYWEQTFADWNDRFRSEAISPVQNKLGAFLANPLTRNIVDQPRNKLNIRRIMDRGQILIVNLSQGLIGESASNLLGAFLVSSLHLAAMSRADTPESDRRDFMGYVDEFQNFATESFASILSQARKYRLSLTMACQYLDQMDEQTQHAVFGNIGSLVTFQTGVCDAELLADQLGPGVESSDVAQIQKYHAFIRLMLNGQSCRPFQMQTIKPQFK